MCSQDKMKKTSIWIFNHYAITPDQPGGTRHYDFAKELIKRGYDIKIFASSFHSTLFTELKKYDSRKYKIENINGIEFVWIKTYPYTRNNWRRIINMLTYAINAYKAARKIKNEKPDVIIGSSPHIFAAYIAFILSNRYYKPFILEIRDHWSHALVNMGISRWNPFIVVIEMLEQYLYKKADKIIMLQPNDKDICKSLNIPEEKTTYINNGVNLERDVDWAKTGRYDEYFNNGKFNVFYAGSIGKVDDVELIIKAGKILQQRAQNVQIYIIGSGIEKEQKMKEIASDNITNISFIDPVPKNEVQSLLKNADALLYHANTAACRYGISPLKLFDYLASAKPVIFAFNAINNIVKEAECGVTVPPDDPNKLSEAIIDMSKLSKQERKAMGKKGREYVEKYHSIPVLVDKLEATLKEVISYHGR